MKPTAMLMNAAIAIPKRFVLIAVLLFSASAQSENEGNLGSDQCFIVGSREESEELLGEVRKFAAANGLNRINSGGTYFTFERDARPKHDASLALSFGNGNVYVAAYCYRPECGSDFVGAFDSYMSNLGHRFELVSCDALPEYHITP